MLRLKTICSGGQTGADIGGLIAAKMFGLQTAGWMPKGFLTTSGPRPEWAERFGLKEYWSARYVPRTGKNVEDADATIRLASDFNSPGELATLDAIRRHKKPYLDVDMSHPRPVKEVVEWLDRFNVETLNVAGNAETTANGICGEVIEYLSEVFRLAGLKETENAGTGV